MSVNNFWIQKYDPGYLSVKYTEVSLNCILSRSTTGFSSILYDLLKILWMYPSKIQRYPGVLYLSEMVAPGRLSASHHTQPPGSGWYALFWPLLWGWKPKDRVTLAPTALQNDLHTCEVNCGPWSEMSTGIPWMRTTCWIRISAVSQASGSFGSATKWAENRSTIVTPTVLPLDGGKPVTKSRAICDHGRWGTGRGWIIPTGCWWEALLRAQMGQAATYSLTSASMDGHQKRWRTWDRVRWIPWWQENWVVPPLKNFGSNRC